MSKLDTGAKQKVSDIVLKVKTIQGFESTFFFCFVLFVTNHALK